MLVALHPLLLVGLLAPARTVAVRGRALGAERVQPGTSCLTAAANPEAAPSPTVNATAAPGVDVAAATAAPQPIAASAAGSTAAPFSVSPVPVNNFPSKPPVGLAEGAKGKSFKMLGGGPPSLALAGTRVRRSMLSATGRDLTISDPSGRDLYSTQSTFFTMHSTTNLFDAQSGRPLAVLSSTLWSLHRTFEIASYEPACEGQQPQSETGDRGVALYPFARMTKSLFSLKKTWTLERYNCDGSLTEQWQIADRYFFQALTHYDVIINSPGTTQVVGAIDQAYIFQWTPHYNAWLASGQDTVLFAAVNVLLDMNALAASASKRFNSINDASTIGTKS